MAVVKDRLEIPRSDLDTAVSFVRRHAPAMFSGNGRTDRRVMLAVAEVLTSEGYTVHVNGYRSPIEQGQDVSHFDTFADQEVLLVAFPPGVEPGFVFG